MRKTSTFHAMAPIVSGENAASVTSYSAKKTALVKFVGHGVDQWLRSSFHQEQKLLELLVCRDPHCVYKSFNFADGVAQGSTNVLPVSLVAHVYQELVGFVS